jgi:hypothetical protein
MSNKDPPYLTGPPVREFTGFPVLMSHELDLAPMIALIAGGLALFLFGLELMTAGPDCSESIWN